MCVSMVRTCYDRHFALLNVTSEECSAQQRPFHRFFFRILWTERQREYEILCQTIATNDRHPLGIDVTGHGSRRPPRPSAGPVCVTMVRRTEKKKKRRRQKREKARYSGGRANKITPMGGCKASVVRPSFRVDLSSFFRLLSLFLPFYPLCLSLTISLSSSSLPPKFVRPLKNPVHVTLLRG